jgi:hypothetical protein
MQRSKTSHEKGCYFDAPFTPHAGAAPAVRPCIGTGQRLIGIACNTNVSADRQDCGDD